ncbi:MAG: hypothetical protein AAB909_01535 [Patescibacteria group bacterium]
MAQDQRRYLLAWAFGPIFIMLAVSFFLPQSQPFRVIYILPAFILAFSQAAMRFPKLFLTLLLYISLTGNITYFTRPRIQREQWRQAVAFLTTRDSVSVVKFSGSFSPIAWYNPDLPVIAAVPSFPAKPDEVASRLIPLSTARSVFVFDYLGELTDPNRVTDQIVKEMGFSEVKIHDFSGVGFIREYHR